MQLPFLSTTISTLPFLNIAATELVVPKSMPNALAVILLFISTDIMRLSILDAVPKTGTITSHC